MSEVSLKIRQGGELRKKLLLLLADYDRDVGAVALCQVMEAKLKPRDLMFKVGMLDTLNKQVIGPEPLESQAAKYMEEMKNAVEEARKGT